MKLFSSAFLVAVILFLSSSGFSLNHAFAEGDQFRRTNSEIFLKYSEDINVENYGLNMKKTGFKILVYADAKQNQKDLGYVTINVRPNEGDIELAFIMIEKSARGKGYGTEALKTVLGIFKAKKLKFPNNKALFLNCAKDNYAMIRSAEKAGWRSVEPVGKYWCPSFMTNFVIDIP